MVRNARLSQVFPDDDQNVGEEDHHCSQCLALIIPWHIRVLRWRQIALSAPPKISEQTTLTHKEARSWRTFFSVRQ